MKLDSQGEKPRSVTIPLDWGKAKKLWRWLRRKPDIPPSQSSPSIANAPAGFPCPVCDCPNLFDNPRISTPTYEICPQCGVEFGFNEPASYTEIRKAWLAAGKPFWQTSQQWQQQLHEIEEQYKI